MIAHGRGLSRSPMTRISVCLMLSAAPVIFAPLVAVAPAQFGWCGSDAGDFACKLNGAATVTQAGVVEQLRLGVTIPLQPSTTVAVVRKSEVKVTFGTQARCQFGYDRGMTSIRTRFDGELLLFDRGAGSCRFPRGARGRVGLACNKGCPVLMEHDGTKIILGSSGRRQLRQAPPQATTLTYEQHVTVDVCSGRSIFQVLQPDGTYARHLVVVRRGRRTRVQIDAVFSTTTSGSSVTSPEGSATASGTASGGSLVVVEEEFNTPGPCARVRF